jgi:hypothetical protein
VSTSKDYAQSFGVNTGTIGGATSSAALTISAAQPFSGFSPSSSTLTPVFDSLAHLLSTNLSFLAVCLDSNSLSAPAMKKLLLAISATESRDPRDPSAVATNMLNLCHSSCVDSSTATLLAMAVDPLQISRSDPQIIQSFCTSSVIALLWQHANNSPRECSDSMITYVGREYNDIGLTTCALRSMLPVYVAMCDAKAIQCEQSLLSMTSAEMQSCGQAMEGNAGCSADCAAFVAKVSSGAKCMENALSIQEVVAHAAQQTCADSGECRVIVFDMFGSANCFLFFDVTNVLFHKNTCYSTHLLLCVTSFAASFVNVYSKRSDWRRNAPILNSKCNPATPFPTDLKDAKVLFEDGWSNRVSVKQPAGYKFSSSASASH